MFKGSLKIKELIDNVSIKINEKRGPHSPEFKFELDQNSLLIGDMEIT